MSQWLTWGKLAPWQRSLVAALVARRSGDYKSPQWLAARSWPVGSSGVPIEGLAPWPIGGEPPEHGARPTGLIWKSWASIERPAREQIMRAFDAQEAWCAPRLWPWAAGLWAKGVAARMIPPGRK